MILTMTLEQFLEKQKMSRAEFARRIGSHPSYITQLCAGKFWPGREIMIRILEVSEGRVTPNDLLGVDVKDYKPQRR